MEFDLNYLLAGFTSSLAQVTHQDTAKIRTTNTCTVIVRVSVRTYIFAWKEKKE